MAEKSLKMQALMIAVRSLSGGFMVRPDREKKELIFISPDGNEEIMTFDQMADSIEEMFKDE